MSNRILFSIVTQSVLCVTLCSCSIIGLRKQIETMESRGGVTVEVIPSPTGEAPTYALAWRMENGERKESAGFQRVRADGLAAFSLSLNYLYRVGAFTDENQNGAYDAGEPLAVLVDVKPRPFGDPSTKARLLKLVLRRDYALPEGTRIELPRESKKLGGKVNIALGDVVSLDEKRFAPETGSSGLWRPLDFLSDNTSGVYFTEPYDPTRVPVVFVYGIGGSPQDFSYLIENLNRKNHQLWFYHYPSGMRLERLSNTLAKSLNMLRKRYAFPKCYVVAHSMGGLVSRTAICEAVAEEGENFIPKFISISTPWGGHAAAESGIRHLKKPVPSWLDVAPNSAFLLRLYASSLPKGTTHDLIYGSIKGGPFYLHGENDGVVTVESETDPRIKKSASSFIHLSYGHTAILEQDETLELVQKFLGQ